MDTMLPSSETSSDIDADSIAIRSVVFDISEHDTTTGIRLIGLPTLVPDFRALINVNSGVSSEPISWERQEGDSHIFTLHRNWFDRSKDPTSWTLMTAVFKYMTENGWALIKATPWWHSMQFTLFFQNYPLLPKVTIHPNDMFVIRFQSWSKISLVDAPFPALKLVRDAVSKYCKDRKGILDKKSEKDGSTLFQLSGNLFDTAAQNVVDSRVLQSEILTGLQQLGFRLAASFDIGLYRTSSDIETWVIQRSSPTEASASSSQKDDGQLPPGYEYARLSRQSKST